MSTTKWNKAERQWRKSMGTGDVVRDPKPTKAARWKKSIRAARQYADSWAREWVKRKYPLCVTCGSSINLQWAHILSGKGDAARWTEINMTRQCERCNNLHEYEPWHLYDWFWHEHGHAAFDDLVVASNQVCKLTYSQIMAIGDGYRELCNKKEKT